jgi:hypothetical protein
MGRGGGGRNECKHEHRTVPHLDYSGATHQEVCEQGAEREQGLGLLLVSGVPRQLLGQGGTLLRSGQHGLVGQLGDGRGTPLLNGHVHLLYSMGAIPG